MEPQIHKPQGDPSQKSLYSTAAAPDPSAAPAQPSVKEGGEVEQGGGSKAPAVGVAGGTAAATDLEKKVRRAERFGMPVMLSEEEKRSSRAERFGTGLSAHASTNGKLEEQKRKARAERFGLTAHTASDEESKKKARLKRFAQNPKSSTSEEEKRKARAARFSQTHTTSASNGNANSEMAELILSS